ncbi:hypothetical protein ACNQGB_01840 [Flavobacterium sp. XS1P32]|uniref:hypothetical protein n=1 Tax=Flavobacterium sp. XS1P32 TaxID=3401726 RepID=UPI003AAD1D82
MIPEKIQALFNFINYLEKNKRVYIEEYIPLCNELKNLDNQRNELNPNENYISKQQYDKIQNEIEEKFSPILSNIYTPVTIKLKELGIWSGDEAYSSIWNNNISAISDFKRSFTSEDILQVIHYKQKYLSFRAETNTDFLCLSFVFQSLDETFKELFAFFKDTNENEFDSFETKAIKVNSMEEAVNGLKENRKGNVKFSIPTKTFFSDNPKKQIQTSTTKVKNKIFMGDKIKTGNITNTSGQISIGKKNTIKTNGNDEMVKKSFNWQKWGIITGTILTIIATIITIIVS